MRTAIPTDFGGVRFRSKSEAMYAAALEFSGLRWSYEPQWLRVGDWVPDFVVYPSRPDERPLAIEYKPARVTDAYLERLAEKFRQLESRRVDTLLAIYNWFSDDANAAFTLYRGKIGMLCQLDFEMEHLKAAPGWLTQSIIQSVKEYRFDLQTLTTE